MNNKSFLLLISFGFLSVAKTLFFTIKPPILTVVLYLTQKTLQLEILIMYI